ncbi:MAG: glycoside hydrolase family 20 zincin-like fold domain-containing protein [Terriglobia bacterium]
MRRFTDTFSNKVGVMLALLVLSKAIDGFCATVSPLNSRGYAVIPEPQKVTLQTGDFEVGAGWGIEVGPGVRADDIAIVSLKEDLASRYHLSIGAAARGSSPRNRIRLTLSPGAVTIGEALDRDRTILAEQAYKIVLSPNSIDITANAAPGLFYGVQTLLQLIRPKEGKLWLPEGEITDWPDLQLREIYWDDAHHLDRLEELKRAVRQAAFFKINGFSIKLEGHFQFKSAPAIVEPYALTPAEFQELTDYGLKYHVQIIPWLDGPSHVAFILKHPEYAPLREFADSNYEFCATNPDTYKLLFGMFEDLLAANKGGKYFHLSTDEPYYVGLADDAQCREKPRAQELGSVGKLLAEFLTKTAGFLHDRGRTVIFWGEYPLKPEDIPALPRHLVNGEVYGPEYDPVFKKHGIRQLIYTSTQGVEPLFPDYYRLPSSERLHPGGGGGERVPGMFEQVSFSPAREQADLMGVVVAAWADAGLHAETFWLGYVTGAAAGWHPGAPDPYTSMNSFYPLFYGSGATNMGRVYQLMSRQAQFWADSWETIPSAREPLFGNSDQIFIPRRPETDQGIPLPPVPKLPYLAIDSDWTQANSKRLQAASRMLAESDELLGLLHTNLRSVEYNRHNLEVFLSIALMCRQNLEMLGSLGRINNALKSAAASALRAQPEEAVAALDAALESAREIQQERNRALHDLEETWYKTWFPRVAEANGRRFLHELDDVKDHVPDRTVDMTYHIYRQLLLPMQEWVEKVQTVRNAYAKSYKLAEKSFPFSWSDTKVASR